jgi:predicted house-cleaning noncanonical NTP pyrophosphatase (MazG superfamily)
MNPLDKQEKLVRDNIAQISEREQDGRTFRIADHHEMAELLNKKLQEECLEVSEELTKDSLEKDKLVEELGDVLEVIDSICSHYKISKKELMKIKDAKRLKKGSFIKKVVLDLKSKK